MAKNPAHKKFMDDYDGLTDDSKKRVSGVENSEAKNSRKWFSKRKAKKSVEINPYDGATVTLRDSSPNDEIRQGLVDEKTLPPSISLEEAWEKAKSRGKKSK